MNKLASNPAEGPGRKDNTVYGIIAGLPTDQSVV